MMIRVREYRMAFFNQVRRSWRLEMNKISILDVRETLWHEHMQMMLKEVG